MRIMRIVRYTYLTSLAIIVLVYRGWACTVCKSNQPDGFENITHGEGPTGITDMLITWSAVIIVGITLFLSIKYLIKPEEHNSNHIKNIVVNEFS